MATPRSRRLRKNGRPNAWFRRVYPVTKPVWNTSTHMAAMAAETVEARELGAIGGSVALLRQPLAGLRLRHRLRGDSSGPGSCSYRLRPTRPRPTVHDVRAH